MANITRIKARQILDSRGNPTVEADVYSGGVWARASVPSGASTGSKEALELRDGDPSFYMGKSVAKAVDNIEKIIAPALAGMDANDLRKVDAAMIDLDGTDNKANLGANALLAVSLATARLGAALEGKALYRYLLEDLQAPNEEGIAKLPSPLMNIVNGGRHASNNLDIQEFMIVPHMRKGFGENFRAAVEVFHKLKELLGAGGHSTNVGDEGGFAPDLEDHDQACRYIVDAIDRAGYVPGRDISLSFDAAASEFYRDGLYHMQGRSYDAQAMVDYYAGLCERYPVYSIEDGLDEGDVDGWKTMTDVLGEGLVLVGDDLFVTNKRILRKGIDEAIANSILIKVNQIGTLSETFETVAMAYEAGYSAIISHRSGETADSFIADLAVATAAGRIKSGSASRSDRLEKYNRLLRIEEELGEGARFDPVK